MSTQNDVCTKSLQIYLDIFAHPFTIIYYSIMNKAMKHFLSICAYDSELPSTVPAPMPLLECAAWYSETCL